MNDELRGRSSLLTGPQARFAGELNRAIADRIAGAIRDERRRIAQELHDAVGHHLVAIALNTRRIGCSCSEAAQGAAAIDELVQLAMRDLRRIVTRLPGRPGPAEPSRSLVADVVDLSARARRGKVLLRFDDVEQEPAVPSAVRQAVVRVIQEGTTNALKYGSGPIDVNVVLGEAVTVTVTNGTRHGSPGATRANGFSGGQGLHGLAALAAELGGSVNWGKMDDGYFQLRATFPAAAVGEMERMGDRECETSAC